MDRTHMGGLLEPILNQTIPVHTRTPSFFKITF
jgi:hypothetical protein